MADISPPERDLGIVFQSYVLFPHMTVAENVTFGLRMRGVAKSEVATRVARALDMVRLPGMADGNPGQLSGGIMQQLDDPHSLYFRPATPFVARFVGDGNAWGGTISQLDEGTLSVDLEGITIGPLPRPDNLFAIKGGRIALYLRPNSSRWYPRAPRTQRTT